jgi:hypothetical protein
VASGIFGKIDITFEDFRTACADSHTFDDHVVLASSLTKHEKHATQASTPLGTSDHSFNELNSKLADNSCFSQPLLTIPRSPAISSQQNDVRRSAHIMQMQLERLIMCRCSFENSSASIGTLQSRYGELEHSNIIGLSQCSRSQGLEL